MTERKVLHCSPDIYLAGRTIYACLWYPNIEGPGSTDAVEVALVDVRAARDIRIEYDYERDGYCISAAKIVGEEGAWERTWVEEAFVLSHEPEAPAVEPELLKTIDPPLVELTSEGKKLFNEPLTIPIEDEKGNVHIFEGCYVKSVEHNYPKDGPLVEESPITLSKMADMTIIGRQPDGNVVPGPEVLGQEEYERRQNDLVLEAVKAISSERLRWCLTDQRKGELAWDPGVKCWMDFATAVLTQRGEL